MEHKIKIAILQLRDLLGLINTTMGTQAALKKAGKPKLVRENEIRVKQLKQSFNHKLKRIEDTICGRVIKVRYLLYSSDGYKPSEAVLTNISDEDATYFITSYMRAKGYEIKILEILEIPTYLCK